MAVAGSLTYDTKLDTKGFSEGLSKVGSATKTAFKGVGVALTGVTTAISGITVAATKAYADYEQLVGGVETLFKESSSKLQAYADEAYISAGLGANAYMETVTSFSASLLQSLGGDTEKAVEYANQAIIDMSDNANKMGTSMEAIQYAYQGFAKQNYTMLDNLKLGYGGTKSEMERLIKDASKLKGIQEELGITVDANSMSFANIVNAISVMQKKMGIAGTTAKEANSTISGSLQRLKASWNNLMVGLASGKDLDGLITNLFNSVSTLASNLMPVLMRVLEQVPTFIAQVITAIVNNLPMIIEQLVPNLIQSSMDILNVLIKGILDNIQTIVETAIQIILSLIQGLTEALPELIPAIVDALILIEDTLIENLDLIIDAGIALIFALIDGLIEALPALIDRIPEIITKLLNAFNDNLPKIIDMGIKLLGKLGSGLIKAIPQLVKKIPEIITALVNGIKGYMAKITEIGTNIVEGVWNGIKKAKDWLLNKIKEFAKTITQGIKDFFGIASPSKVMAKEVGQWLPKGISVGIDANTDSALNSIDKMNDEIMNKMNQAVNTEVAKASFSGTSGSVSQILSANSMIQVENYNKLYLDGEEIYENQQTVQQRKNLQYSFGGGTSK